MVNGNILLLNGRIKLPKLKFVRIKQHREIPQHHIIKSCTISTTPTGKLLCIDLDGIRRKRLYQKEVKNIVGLDFTMDGLYTDSTRMRKPITLSFYRQMLDRLAKAQRRISKTELKVLYVGKTTYSCSEIT